ncbi:hypothetical protein GO988_17320 [Hymenobacter sp. HMF4947]|uniref:Uncharacterized protein n=1 Tax=Hymenobacter ginkgonis TaxID=2682976 RepID=A0A7K1TI97_9BACT|nr:hypothetical protein [Hymenobacter ginkgonis]MVN78093.1 hypothetical protein [Hymenobacter ginkgonis]
MPVAIKEVNVVDQHGPSFLNRAGTGDAWVNSVGTITRIQCGTFAAGIVPTRGTTYSITGVYVATQLPFGPILIPCTVAASPVSQFERSVADSEKEALPGS